MLSPKEYISLEAACVSIKAGRPALLEGLARLLLGVVDTGSRFDESTICVIENGKPNPAIALTYEDIGEYLMAATGKHVPVLLQTANEAVASSRVLVARSWISMMELSTKERTIQSQRLEIQKLQEKLETSSKQNNGPRRQPAKERAIMAVHKMASRLWASPEFKDYRIGDMAGFIKIHMIANEPEHAGAMPELTSTVVKWLKQMTGIPDGASLPGRPSKSKN